MFGFKKKEVNVEKVKQFSRWFFENEERIRSSVENRQNDSTAMMRVLDEVEAELAKVYRDGYNGTIEFDYGGEGNAYHDNDAYRWFAKLHEWWYEGFHSCNTLLGSKIFTRS